MITQKEKERLRQLAHKQLEYANTEQNNRLKKEWYRHRRFEKGKPMVLLEIGGFRDEVYLPRMQCESLQARQIENRLLSLFLRQEIYQDDSVVPDYFPVYYDTWFHLFGHEIKKVNAEDSIGHRFEHVIRDLEEDYGKLGASTYGIDREGSQKLKDMAEDILGDILPVKWTMNCLQAVPTQKIIHLMGLENFIYAMSDYPDLVKKMMMRAADDYISYFNWMKEEKILLPTTGDELLNQGTYCYTQELPDRMERIGLSDVWGYLDSQESSSISPDMYGEFIFPSYKKIAEVFGLLSYGCCEPVHPIWEKYVSRLDNLRNISISAWCDVEYMGEHLRGKKIIFQRKPTANFLAVDVELQEEEVRKYMSQTIRAARGCQLEITQRDVLTIHKNEKKAARYIEIIREEIEKNWKG